MRLRYWLGLTFSLLLFFTAALIGWRGFSNSRDEIHHFTREEFAQDNAFTAHHVLDFLDDPARRLLDEYTLRATRGMLPLTDLQALGLDLAERLRVHPTLAWISYSDAATGRFVGVWRTREGDIVLNQNAPGPGHAREVVVHPDGTLTPYVRKEPASYDPREYPWYKNAAGATTTVWSDPYDFLEGVRGITASRAWRPGDGAPAAGVFTVDFFLRDLAVLLDGIATDSPGLVCAVLEPDGTPISASSDDHGPQLLSALGNWIKTNPQFKDNGGGNNHLVSLDIGGTEYLAALQHVKGGSGLKCIVASLQPRNLIYRGLERAEWQMIGIAAGALAVSMLLGAYMAYRISEPLRVLGDELTRVGKFHLADGTRMRSAVHEVNQLNDAAERMKTGLRSFLKYVPGDLVRQVLASGREAALGGEIRTLTVFFSDIENFTTYTERTPPDQLVHELAEYLEIVSGQLRRHEGEIDKFIGDGILAFFNAPADVAGHERQACLATLAALRELDARPRAQERAIFRTRVGLHTGDVLVGNIGTAERLAYTVLGDVVNVTSRLENLNKLYGTQVLASGEVRARAGAQFEWRHVDRACVAGRTAGLEIFELLGTKGDVDAGRLRERDAYEQALELYFAREFSEAAALFARSTTGKAAELLAARCQAFAANPPPADWGGVYAHDTKG
jgi:adenylate cyclase